MDALTGTSLSLALLFCLWSFLFGLFASLLAAGVRAIFLSLRLLSDEKRESKISFRAALGFFLYDVIVAILLSCAYLIFLYVANGGIFRLHSLLLAVCGFFLFFPVARCFFRPFQYLLSGVLAMLARIFCFPIRIFLHFWGRISRKKIKRLDEKGKIV